MRTTAQESPELKEALNTLTVGIKKAVKLWPTRMDGHDVDNLISEVINRLWRSEVSDERLAKAWDEGQVDGSRCADGDTLMDIDVETHPVGELVTWLETAQMRWGHGNYKVTYRLDGSALSIYQDGTYRAAVTLLGQPMLTDWADDDA